MSKLPPMDGQDEFGRVGSHGTTERQSPTLDRQTKLNSNPLRDRFPSSPPKSNPVSEKFHITKNVNPLSRDIFGNSGPTRVPANRGHNTNFRISLTSSKQAPGHNLEITGQRPEGSAAKIPQEPAFVLEEVPQPLGGGEDHLAMRHVQETIIDS